MNLNPFVYKYKVFPESKKATNISHMSSLGERIGFLFGGGILLMCLVYSPGNLGEALFASLACLGGGWYIHRNKETWINDALVKDGINTNQGKSHQGEVVHLSDQSNSENAQLRKVDTDDVKSFCSQCGKKVESNARFCPNCGHGLE